jgi:hypothetical protein
MAPEIADTPLEVGVECRAEFLAELRAEGESAALVPLGREGLRDDLGDLIEEVYVRGVLAERLGIAARRITATIEPRPLADPEEASEEAREAGERCGISVCVSDDAGGECEVVFGLGPWVRRAQERLALLREEGRVPAGARARLHVRSFPAGDVRPPVPYLLAPPIEPARPDELWTLGPGELDPDRPVLVAARALEAMLALTESAGPIETGGAVLGRQVRLEQPLPGTRTRIATLLCACLSDPRHRGEAGHFTFDPAAMAEAAQIAALRGRGERALSAFHSHGWNGECGRCNQNRDCPLPACSEVSLEDYRVAETLFPGKATLLPVTGRRFGAAGTRPVLELFAWTGGALLPLPWRTYDGD